MFCIKCSVDIFLDYDTARDKFLYHIPLRYVIQSSVSGKYSSVDLIKITNHAVY